jgi:hypothetical protein
MVRFVCSNGKTFNSRYNSGFTEYFLHGTESVIPAVAASKAARAIREMSWPYDVYQIHLWIDYEVFVGTREAGP